MQNSYSDHRNFDSINRALVSFHNRKLRQNGLLRTIASEGRAIPASLSCVDTTKAWCVKADDVCLV
jgi:hypothetical protein